MVPERTCRALLAILICVSAAAPQSVRAQTAPVPAEPVMSDSAGQPPASQPIPRTDIPPSARPPVASSLPSSAAPPLAAPPNRTYHYFQSADMPPGSIGQAQLLRGGPLPGYFQPVEISAPKGVQLALAMEGTFEPPQPAPLAAGLLIGSVYRLRVTNIPFHEGQEVFPSVEIINRLYPPPGSETRFPIPIELTREELELAVRGQFVIRVIYLENPRIALPRREDPEHQRYFEVGPGQDPLEVADSLGRPMAILRIGSRVPELDQATGRFLFDCPPWMRFPRVLMGEPTEAPGAPSAEPQQPGAAHEVGGHNAMGWRSGPVWERHSARTTAQTRPAGVGVNQ